MDVPISTFLLGPDVGPGIRRRFVDCHQRQITAAVVVKVTTAKTLTREMISLTLELDDPI